MPVYLNRKIFPAASGGGSLNVNGALGLTTGTAGEALLENDLIFKSPDITTDYFPIDTDSSLALEFPLVAEVNGTKYMVATTNAFDTINHFIRILKYNNSTNAWEVVAQDDASLFAYMPQSISVWDTDKLVITLGGWRDNSVYRNGAVLIYNTTLESLNIIIQSDVVADSGSTNFLSAVNSRFRYVQSESLIIGNTLYMAFYLNELYSGGNSNALTINNPARGWSLDLSNPTGFSTWFTIPSPQGYPNWTLSGTSPASGSLQVSDFVMEFRMVEENGVPLIVWSYDFDPVNTSTHTRRTHLAYENNGVLTVTENSFLYTVAQGGTPWDGFYFAGSNSKAATLLSLNGFIYLLYQAGQDIYTFKKPIGGGVFQLQDTTPGNGEDNLGYARNTDFTNLPTFDARKSSKFFKFNGIIYTIQFFDVAPYFAALSLVDDVWVQLPQPINAPFAQAYSGQFLVTSGNEPTYSNYFIRYLAYLDNVFVNNNKILFISQNTSVDPYYWVWESTNNGTFTFEWIKEQQSFADAIGIAQENAASDASFSVYQMTPGS